LGLTTYLLSPERDPDHVSNHLEPGEFTLAEALKAQGYATGYFGKWHLGYANEHWAGVQGFDVAKGGMDLPWAWRACYPDREPPMKKGHTRFFSPHHLTHLENGPEGEYLTDRLTSETIGFIEDNRDRPFFAFLSFHTVHTPLQAKPEVVEKYRRKIQSMGLDQKKETNKKEKHYQNNPHYAAMVHHMDENVGRLLQRLAELGQEENTVVIFTSDNGGKGSVTSNFPLKGAKHNLNEGGIRVPLIVKWPGRILARSRSAATLVSNDFYPTLLDLAGCPLIPDQHCDGVSFSQHLLGKKQAPRQEIYWHYPHNRNESAVRIGDFKLLHFHESGKSELYNLQTDVGEKDDLSAHRLELSKSMLNKLKEWQKKVSARFPGGGGP
jgi:arylsulfatase A-like enzyme